MMLWRRQRHILWRILAAAVGIVAVAPFVIFLVLFEKVADRGRIGMVYMFAAIGLVLLGYAAQLLLTANRLVVPRPPQPDTSAR
jgi:hypothetical protein